MMAFRRWWVWAAAVAVVCVIVLAFGIRERRARQAGDPAFRALAVVALARDGAEQPLTKDQIRAIIPLLRSLKDFAPDEREATRAVAREILNTLTPEQRAELRNQRRAFPGGRPGRSGQDGTGFAGGGRRFADAGGEGSGPPDRLQMRARIIDRAVAFLEQRMRE
jgi:uncharacterized membrane protein YgcG